MSQMYLRKIKNRACNCHVEKIRILILLIILLIVAVNAYRNKIRTGETGYGVATSD